MVLSPLSYASRTYRVATPIFEGPLDLLLHLIERAELDITALALAQVTDQYLEHLRQMTELPAEELSAFLVIAAKLLQIKSEALLPRPPLRELGEEETAEALARQLILYRRYRRAAEWLEARQQSGMRSYLRLAAPPRIEAPLDLSGASLNDLVQAAQAILYKNDNRLELRTVVGAPVVTIREKISLLRHALLHSGRLIFQRLLTGATSRIEIVVTFLALLELVKRHLVIVRQESLFGEIQIEQAAQLDENEELELEFGE